MRTVNAIGMRLAAACMLLAPLAAQGRLYLDGPEVWYQGDTITIVLTADVVTPVWAFEFGTDEAYNSVYDKFASVLVLEQSPVVADFIKTGWGACYSDDAACSFIYADLDPQTLDPLPLLIPAGPVVTWRFLVKADPDSDLTGFDLDLAAAAQMDPVAIQLEPVLFDTPKDFRVLPALAIPEEPSWILMIVGLAAVGTRAYQRRRAV